MKRAQRILNDPEFLRNVQMNEACEKERKFCTHGLSHFLDVARIAYILNFENGLSLDKEKIYAAALLHDIGKWKQYEDGTPHEKSGAELAAPILRNAGFLQDDIREITEAVSAHREPESAPAKNLTGVLFCADKLSRNCLFCGAKEDCHRAHKNSEINI